MTNDYNDCLFLILVDSRFPEIVDNSLKFILSKSLNYEEYFVSLYSK